MKKYSFLLVHIVICMCWVVLNFLFFVGPEPGILTQYIYNFVNHQLAVTIIIMIYIIGLPLTLSIYFNMGKQIQCIDNKTISIVSITLFNFGILLVIYFFTKDIDFVKYWSQLTLNAPFFVLIVQFPDFGIWSMIFFALVPSMMLFIGYIKGEQ